MVAAHVPALISAWGAIVQNGLDPSRLGGCLGLSAATAFFLLKLWGVPCLRFATGYRSLITIGVAVVLIHADAIGAHLPGAVVPKELPVAASTLLAAGMSRVQEVVRSVCSRDRASSKPVAPPLSLVESARFGAFTPCNWLISSQLCVPRGPPA
ncbi:MAG: hypothetical protein V3W34_09175 [Phycisphaerae bacterium]